MESQINVLNKNIMKLRKDVELIKNMIVSEGELTDWAKKELVKARAEKEEGYTRIEEI